MFHFCALSLNYQYIIKKNVRQSEVNHLRIMKKKKLWILNFDLAHKTLSDFFRRGSFLNKILIYKLGRGIDREGFDFKLVPLDPF